MVRLEETVIGALSTLRDRLGGMKTPLIEGHIKENPKDPKGYLALAFNEQNHAKALRIIREGREKCGENSLFCHAGAMKYGSMGMTDEAVEALKAAIDLDPINTTSILSLATLLNRTGRYTEAKEWWLRLIELDPEIHSAWFGLGKSEHELGNHEDALNAMNAALFIAPKEGIDENMVPAKDIQKGYLHSRATGFIELGRLDEAMEDIERIFKLDKRHAKKAAGELISVYQEKGREGLPVILKLSEKMMELFPETTDDPTFFLGLSLMYKMMGQTEKIGALFDRAMELGMPESKALDFKGMALIQAGLYEEALKTYERLIKLTGEEDYRKNITAIEAIMSRQDMSDGLMVLPSVPGGPEPGSVFERPPPVGMEGPSGPGKKAKIGRNDPCPCGSGKKFKKCHLGREDDL
jgi:tetratricopeptide (TPR) repeat protein